MILAWASPFNQISTRQVLEHVNKLGKTAGGLMGITRSVYTARDEWCLTFNERSEIAKDIKLMFGLDTLDEENSYPTMKDLAPSRLNRDKTDVPKITKDYQSVRNVWDIYHQVRQYILSCNT